MRESQAILVVSFGTSHKETREKTIEAIEQEIRDRFPAWEVRRAFTSSVILRVLKRRDGVHIDNVAEAMEGLRRDGFTHVVIQPTHVLSGQEYDKMKAQLVEFRGSFQSIAVGTPLLTESGDYEDVCRGIMRQFPRLSEKEALVLMGHGTEHFADSAYGAINYRFRELGYDNVFVGTVEGYPDLGAILKQVKEYGPEKVYLMPLMVVAGDHAVNDMASDQESSWKSVFQREGFQVDCVLKGLGELKEIRDIYVRHARKAMEK